MIINHDRVVLPYRVEWLAMLILVGVFGFVAQAGHSMRWCTVRLLSLNQVLLTMGLQRETAGRGTMAIYVLASVLTALLAITESLTKIRLCLLCSGTQ